MANQQPARPWFRVASLSRPSPPPPLPQPPAPTPEVTAPPQPRPFRTLTALAPPAATQPPLNRPPGPALQPTGAAPSLRPPSGAATVQASPAVRAGSIVASSLPSSPRPAIPPAPTSSLPSSPVRKPALATGATVSSVPASPVQAPKTSSVPSSAVSKPIPTISSVPKSPNPEPAATSARNSPAIKAVSESSLRSAKPVAETPPQSPKRNPTAPPPSPLTLPPSQLNPEPEPKFPPEAEQKTVVLQKTVENHSTTKKFWSGGIESEGGAENHLMGLRVKEENHKKTKNPSDSEDKGTRIITIAGENKGALMELFRSPRKSGNPFLGNPRYLHSRRNHETSSGSGSSSGEDGEGKKKAERRSESGRGNGTTPMSAVMNSNVQGINNSIMFNSSCNHHDPGVHVALSRNPSDGGGSGGFYKVKDHRSNGC